VTRRPPAAGERGAVAVEMALVLPALLAVVVGGLYLGRVLTARHRLADAVGYAARGAMIATAPGQVADPGTANALVQARMAGGGDCAQVVTRTATTGLPPYRRVTVTGRCLLRPPFGGGLLGNLGASSVTASASMPLESP
jgi:Flp pilus assembly protein TadG